MEALFFGDTATQLYGVYHAPAAGVHANRALLMCYPAGHEYTRIHRCYRQIASQLNDLGFHVFRFDYVGTGDSAGEHTEIRIEQWVQDTLHAMEEVRALSGVKKIDVLGTRFGAIVAALASAQDKFVKSLVAWEPCLSGKSYLEELASEIEKAGPTQTNFFADDGELHYNGYRLTVESMRSFEKALYPEGFLKAPQECHVISASPGQVILSNLGAVHHTSEDEINWHKLSSVGGLFMPYKAVQKIVGVLGGNS